MSFYRQCELMKGATKQVAWVPVAFCKVGTNVELLNETSQFEKGWKIANVFTLRQDGDYLKEHERDWKTQRKASDL
jgi:hypothetical protein